MTALTRTLSHRLWISVFLLELFGSVLICLIAAWMLPSRLLKLAGLGGGVVLIGSGLLLLAPPVYRRVRTHETAFRLASTVPLDASYTPALMLFEALLVFFMALVNTSPFIYFQF